MTLIDCDVYENMQEAGIDSSSPFYRDDGPAPNSKWKYVQCSLEIENVDAVPEGDDGLFGIDSFGLFVEGGTQANPDRLSISTAISRMQPRRTVIASSCQSEKSGFLLSVFGLKSATAQNPCIFAPGYGMVLQNTAFICQLREKDRLCLA